MEKVNRPLCPECFEPLYYITTTRVYRSEEDNLYQCKKIGCKVVTIEFRSPTGRFDHEGIDLEKILSSKGGND